MESLKGESTLQQPNGESRRADGVEELKSEAADEEDNSGSDIDKEEIVKELKEVKRQNSVTHWLLSIMIVLTVAWQVSELSLLLKVTHKVKHGFSHPFRFLGGMFTGMLKGRGTEGEDEENQNHIEAPSLPSIKNLELPHVEVPDLGNNHEQH